MRFKRFALPLIALAFVLGAGLTLAGGFNATAGTADKDPQVKPGAPAAVDDPVLKKIIEIGKTDNQVMTWLDYASNRFGGRYTGTDAYANASAWALWQFKQFGVQAELDEAHRDLAGLVKAKPDFDSKYPALGKVIAGADVLKKLAKDDAVRSVRIIRVGQAAKAFKTDNDSYRKLVEKAAK